MKKLLILLLIVGCGTEPEPKVVCIEDVEVKLWDVCYNIEETDSLDISGYIDMEYQVIYGGLTDSIPPEIGNLINLETLYLYGNQLTGSIPSEIGLLINLKKLGLHSNQLSGEIPSEIGNLTSLEKLLLSDNQLSGEIPSELYKLNLLNELKLSNNNLSGNIDTLICSMESLFPGPNESGENLYEQENPTPIALGQNSFCPEYPFCLERSSYRPLLGQDTSNCP